jgi:hypothetical protein
VRHRRCILALASRRLQSLLIRGGGASNVHVSLVAGRGQGSLPTVAEARGSAPEQLGERSATVEAADRSGAAPRVGGLQARNPQAGLVGPPGEEVPGALQDVSFHSRSLHCELFNLPCLLTLILSSRRHADTGVLRLAPLKRLALSARVMPSEPHPKPPYAEPLPVQVDEGLAVATAVEDSGAPPPSVTSAVVEEEQTVTETTAPKLHWIHRPGPAQVAQTW